MLVDRIKGPARTSSALELSLVPFHARRRARIVGRVNRQGRCPFCRTVKSNTAAPPRHLFIVLWSFEPIFVAQGIPSLLGAWPQSVLESRRPLIPAKTTRRPGSAHLTMRSTTPGAFTLRSAIVHPTNSKFASPRRWPSYGDQSGPAPGVRSRSGSSFGRRQRV